MSAALAELAEVLDYLTPQEQRILDADLIALTTGQAHEEYQKDPIGWMRDKLDIPEYTIRWSSNSGYEGHEWDGTPDPLVNALNALANWEDVGIESATGTGKSYTAAAGGVLWFLAVFQGARVFTFAPKEDQLRLYIWAEIAKLWPKFQEHFPGAELSDLRIRMDGTDNWGAWGYAVGVKADEQIATKASGMHAEHMLLVYEEMPGIPQPIIEAGENTCTAPHNLRWGHGNPNHKLDALHKYCTSPGVRHIRISALDHPNVVSGDENTIPGAVSPKSIERRRLKYTEASPHYQSRVRGISPDQASDALIRLSWLEASAVRYEARKQDGTLPTVITGKGVDVANSEHGDKGCIADFADNCLVRLEAFPCPDANALGRTVNLEIIAAGLDPLRVGVDTIGVGAGTYNELHRLKKRVQGLVASSKPLERTEKAPDGGTYEWAADGNVFRHLRDQMYWQLREDLRLGRLDMPKDEDLWEELTEPKFVDEPKTIVEPKEEIKERLGRSPDKADAVVMGNWVRLRHIPKQPKEPPHKEAHKAQPILVKDGKLIKPEREPRTLEELSEWAAKRFNRGRVVSRERMPRWK